MDVAYLAYVLFVIPGFVLVWSYRHFTKAKQIGDFEYAAWSLVWGTLIFILIGLMIKIRGIFGTIIESFTIVLDPNNPLELLSTALAVCLILVTIIAFPVGYFGAWLSAKGCFRSIDKVLFNFLQLY